MDTWQGTVCLEHLNKLPPLQVASLSTLRTTTELLRAFQCTQKSFMEKYIAQKHSYIVRENNRIMNFHRSRQTFVPENRESTDPDERSFLYRTFVAPHKQKLTFVLCYERSLYATHSERKFV